jgi:hypothetical protein
MRATALAALALAGAAAAQPTSCSIRLVHEVQTSTSLSLIPSTGPAVVSDVPLFGVSSYSALPSCSAASYQIVDQNSAVVAPLQFTPSDLTSQYTVVVISTPWDTTLVKLLLDRDTQLDDGPKATPNIDIAAYKVFNALSIATSADINGVTANCYNCTHPYLSTVLFAESSAQGIDDYSLVDTTWPYEFQIAAGDAGILSTVVTQAPREHGAYTLFIHNVPNPTNDSSVLLTWAVDTDGRDAYLPILYTFFILLGIGIVHRAGKWLAVKVALTTDIGDNMVRESEKSGSGKKKGSSSSSSSDDVTLLSFLGYDKAICKAVLADRAQKKAGGGASAINGDEDSGKNGAVNLSERLLAAVDDHASAGVIATSNGKSAGAAAAPASTKPRSGGRVRAIDTFRGLCLAIMIFVNYGGGAYEGFFDHSKWNGLTVADLVFPWFVWTSGVSMAISFASERKRGAKPMDLAKKTVIRAMKLYGIGLFLNGGAQLSSWRVIGVLQYFSISYLVVGLVESFLSPLAYAGSEGSSEEVMPTTLREVLWLDVGRYWLQWLVMLTLGMIYLVVQFYLPIPNCPTGYIGPGGLADQGLYFGLNCTGGAHRVVDVAIFGIHHIYHNEDDNGVASSSATCSGVGGAYECDVHDPEGALGWISAAWMAWLGLQAGRVITTYRHLGAGPGGVKATVRPYILRWICWGVPFALIGGALAGFAKEGGIMPVNKNLWSPSFVFILAGELLLRACSRGNGQ